MISAKTKKWGNSLEIIIPKEKVENLKLKAKHPNIMKV